MQVHWNPQHAKHHLLKQHEDFRLDVQLMNPCKTGALTQALHQVIFTMKLGHVIIKTTNISKDKLGPGKEFLPCKNKYKDTYEFAASLKPFSIAGTKFDGITCPTIMLSNSNLVDEPGGRGSIYLANT